MGGVSKDAWDLAAPVLQLLGATAVVVFSLMLTLWRGFAWLEERIGKRISGWGESKEFKHAVAEIVTQAAAGWNDINNRLHEEHRRGISELRKRDEERLESVKRAHQRIDGVLEKGGKG